MITSLFGLDIRTSCYLVEKLGTEFYYDCMKGIKGKLCAESIGLTYDRVPQFLVDPRLSSVNFKRKRPVGRPKNIGPALSKTPPRIRNDLEIQVLDWGTNTADDPVVENDVLTSEYVCTDMAKCNEAEKM